MLSIKQSYQVHWHLPWIGLSLLSFAKNKEKPADQQFPKIGILHLCPEAMKLSPGQAFSVLISVLKEKECELCVRSTG